MFLLNGLPFPRVPISSRCAQMIVKSTRKLLGLGKSFYGDNKRMSSLRATIDVAVLKAYGLALNDMRLILDDFPLLDRKQPPIGKERKSTITRDIVLSFVCTGAAKKNYEERVREARRHGAKAYIPYEMRLLTQGGVR